MPFLQYFLLYMYFGLGLAQDVDISLGKCLNLALPSSGEGGCGVILLACTVQCVQTFTPVVCLSWPGKLGW